MLQLLRSGLTSYFATALLGLLIASFALWGIGGDILTGGRNDIAKIGSEKLSMRDYSNNFQNNFNQIQQRSGSGVSREIVIDQGMAQRWLVDLVQRRAFAYAAHKLDLRVTDSALRKYIMNIEAFQDTLGQFSKSKFKSIASYQGYSTSEFEKILRRDLERQSLMTTIVSGFSVPKSIEKILIKYLLEQRTANIITVPATTIKNIPQPDEKTLKKYYQDNYARYMAPEYRNLRFITLSSKDFMKNITLTAKEIDQAMATTAKTSDTGVKRDYQQILFNSKADAAKAYADLKAGRAFADIITASGSSIEDATGSSTSQKDASESYGDQAAKIIYSTKVAHYTAPIKTDFGWRIFKITKVTASTAAKGNTRATVEQQLKKAKAIDILYNKSEKVNDELAAGSSLSDIAAKLSLKLKIANNVNSAGYNSTGNLVTGLPKDPAFLLKAFALSPGDDPVLEEMNDGDYFLLVVDHVEKTALRPFKNVRTSVLEGWKADTRKDMARKEANSILKKTQSGSIMKKLAAATAGTSYTAVTLARNDPAGKVTKSIKASIFTLKTGQAKVIPAADGNGFIVVKLLSRKLSDNAMPTAQSAKIKDLLKQEYQQRLLSRYWGYLETSLPVKINQAAVKAANDQLASRGQ